MYVKNIFSMKLRLLQLCCWLFRRAWFSLCIHAMDRVTKHGGMRFLLPTDFDIVCCIPYFILLAGVLCFDSFSIILIAILFGKDEVLRVFWFVVIRPLLSCFLMPKFIRSSAIFFGDFYCISLRLPITTNNIIDMCSIISMMKMQSIA